MTRPRMMVVALVTAVVVALAGCSFVGARPRVDLALAGASLVGSVAMGAVAEHEADECHRRDNCAGGGVGPAIVSGLLGVATLGFLVGAIYGAVRDSRRQARAVPVDRPAL